MEYNQPELPSSDHWEIIWAEPRVLLSDSLYTLIRSDWIDSIQVEGAPQPFSRLATSVHFEVDVEDCFVAANLLDERGSLIRPLLVQTFRRGHYKISLDFSRLDQSIIGGSLFLDVEYCGFHRRERFQLSR